VEKTFDDLNESMKELYGGGCEGFHYIFMSSVCGVSALSWPSLSHIFHEETELLSFFCSRRPPMAVDESSRNDLKNQSSAHEGNRWPLTRALEMKMFAGG